MSAPKRKHTPLERLILAIVKKEGPMTPDQVCKRVAQLQRKALKQKCPTCGK